MKGPILAFDADATRGARPEGADDAPVLPSFLRKPAAAPERAQFVRHAPRSEPPLSAALARQGPDRAVPAVEGPPSLSANPARPALAPVSDRPAPETPALFAEKARARAELAAFYAGLLGVTLSHGDLLERMVLSGSDTVTPGVIANALKETGLRASVLRAPKITPALWPALVEMTSGQIVLVLSQQDQTLIVYDKTCPGDRAEVPLDEFLPVYAGTIIRGEPGLVALARRHIPREKPPHWFWGQFARFRRSFAEVAMGSLVANLLAMAVALFSLQIYDRVIPHQSVSTLWVLAVGAMVALLFEGALRIARATIMDYAGKGIELDLQNHFMAKILGMKAEARQQPAEMAAAMRDFSAVREFFTASTVGSLTDLPFIVLFLGLFALMGGPVVWILVGGGVLMVLPALLAQRKMMALTRAAQGARSKSGRLLYEVIYEADTIKAHRGEDRMKRDWDELSKLSAAASSEQRRLASVLTYWASGVQQAIYVAAIVTGTYLVFAGQLTVGTMIAVGILASRSLAPLTQLSGILVRWSNVKSALQALDRIAFAPQDEEEGRSYLRRSRLTGRYDLRDVGYRYDEKGARVLDIAGLVIEPGQRVALLGANGAGKSTFLRLLSGLSAPSQGHVMVDGVDMARIMPRDLRRNIGWLGQEVRLFAGSLRDNLNLTLLERDDDRLLAALDFAGLGSFVRNHPLGLDLPIADGGAGLSVGQRQSIGWARLWLQDPAIVLLDEPTAAMDQTLEATLVARLDQWLKGRTAVIATHRMPILNLATRVMMMQGGRIVVDGPKAEVLAHLARATGVTLPQTGTGR